MLKSHYYDHLTEAGCDEAGRGCLAGSVYAAAVILPPDYTNDELNDSKKLTEKKRYLLRSQIQHDALAWAVGVVTPEEIDKINILNASILAMHRALDQLSVRPEAVIIDGNRFKPYQDLPYTTIVKGDAKYLSIAAASILAKTYRDDYMNELAQPSTARLSDNGASPPCTASRTTCWATSASLPLTSATDTRPVTITAHRPCLRPKASL